MADFIFKIQPNIILSPYVSNNAGSYARDFGSRFILITDTVISQTSILDKITASLTENRVNFFTYSNIDNNADSKTLEEILNLSKNAHIDGVIAVGGTKVISLGRAVSSLYNEEQYIYNFLDNSTPKAQSLPLICIPTTIRDNFIFSEITPIVDSRTGRLQLIKNQNSLCKAAIFDPTLTSTLPDNQRTAMAIETLCLACETYLSRTATFFSEMISCKAIELIGLALQDKENASVTTPTELLMSQGGCIASLSAGTSSIGPASLMALCINTKYNIPSYFTSIILFPYVIEDATKYNKVKITKIARILGINSSDDKCTEELQNYIRQKLAAAGLPTRLKDLDLTLAQLSAAAEEAGDLDLINKLPRSMTTEDIFDLIKKAY